MAADPARRIEAVLRRGLTYRVQVDLQPWWEDRTASQPDSDKDPDA